MADSRGALRGVTGARAAGPVVKRNDRRDGACDSTADDGLSGGKVFLYSQREKDRSSGPEQRRVEANQTEPRYKRNEQREKKSETRGRQSAAEPQWRSLALSQDPQASDTSVLLFKPT